MTNPYVILGAILGALLALAGAVAFGYHKGVESKAQEIGVLKQQVKNLTDSGKSCLEAVNKLRDANDQLAKDRADDKRKADAALVEVIQQRDVFAQQARTARAKREIVYVRDKASSDWADRCGALPDAIVDGLHDDEGGGEAGDGGGQGPGAGPIAPGAHDHGEGAIAPGARLLDPVAARLH